MKLLDLCYYMLVTILAAANIILIALILSYFIWYPMNKYWNSSTSDYSGNTMDVKICPFCGGIGSMAKVDRYPDCDIQEDKWAYYVRCVSCACEGPWAKSETSATKLWNTRTRPDPAEVKRLVDRFEYHIRWSYEYLHQGHKDLSEIETDKAREARADLLKLVGRSNG
jgi:hypothetical protein